MRDVRNGYAVDRGLPENGPGLGRELGADLLGGVADDLALSFALKLRGRLVPIGDLVQQIHDGGTACGPVAWALVSDFKMALRAIAVSHARKGD